MGLHAASMGLHAASMDLVAASATWEWLDWSQSGLGGWLWGHRTAKWDPA